MAYQSGCGRLFFFSVCTAPGKKWPASQTLKTKQSAKRRVSYGASVRKKRATLTAMKGFQLYHYDFYNCPTVIKSIPYFI